MSDIATQRHVRSMEQLGLAPLMQLTRGRPEVSIGLIDGPVDMNNPRLATADIQNLSGAAAVCGDRWGAGCEHGTFLASFLVGSGEEGAGGLCRDCRLLTRPIFGGSSGSSLPAADALTLASAMVDVVEAGASVINLSLSVGQVDRRGSAAIADAVDFACSRGAIVVAASGNSGTLGFSPLASHPWVIPVVACDDRMAIMPFSNIGRSVGMNGLAAPGLSAFSASTRQTAEPIVGTSVAAVFVTAAAALLRSAFPKHRPDRIVEALRAAPGRRQTVIPPVLDAWASYQRLNAA